VKLVGESLMNQREREALLEMMPPDGLMLEIGTADGWTVAWLAERLPEARFVSVDTFPRPGEVRGAVGSFERWRANARPNQALWVGTARRLAELFPFGVFDLTLVDGEHTFEACSEDLKAAGVLTSSRGTICLHDFERPSNGVKAAFESWHAPWQVVRVVGSMAVLRRKADKELHEKLRELGYA